MNLKNILIMLSIVAVVIVAIAFYVVFYSGGGTYVVSSVSGSDADIFGDGNIGTSTALTASSTASSTAFASSSVIDDEGSSSGSSTTSSSLSTFGNATSVSWTQGNDVLSVTGALLSGSQLTLDVQVLMGSVSECVPLTMRLIADEQGDLSPPITSQFTFPDSGTCTGTPGETYSAQPIVFTLSDPTDFPILLTTGGTANILFEVVQNPDGSLSVQLPPSSD